MNAQAKELRQQRAALIAQMQDLTKDNGSWNAAADGAKSEAQQRWEKLNGEQEKLATQINAVEQNEKLNEEMRAVQPPPQPQPQIDPEKREVPTAETATKRMTEKLESKEYRQAFNHYVRFGENRMPSTSRDILYGVNSEYRSYSGLSTSTGGDASGYTIPIGFQRELEIAMKAYGRMREACRVITTSTGNTLDWPTMDDTSNVGEFLGEAVAVNQLNPTFGQVQFGSNLASSKQVLVSVQLLQDSAFDMEGLLREAFAIRLGRILNTKYTLGTGSSEPQGLVYALKALSVPPVVDATGSSTNDGVSGNTEANSMGSDDLDNLISDVDPAYRVGPKVMFQFHWKTIDYLRKLKDKYGRPLWNASIAVGEPDRIYGYPFDWNADLDQIGAGKYPALFGDFSKHLIRDVAGITVVRYNELYMPNHQVGFQAFLRTDSRLLQGKAFAILRNPLS